MGRKKAKSLAGRAYRQSLEAEDPAIAELRKKQMEELGNLTFSKHPFRTLHFFALAAIQYVRRLSTYTLQKSGLLVASVASVVVLGFLLFMIGGLHEKHALEFLNYVGFGLWWVALGVASSIGLGSGLHTFVLYLGPHIALFTIKALQCGRVDLKVAPYDTIQLKRGPSWLERECAEFGPPLYSSSDSTVRIRVLDILPKVQLEAVLWGLGTALGELPPYFISRAARLSGSKLQEVRELDDTSEVGVLSSKLNKLKCWLRSHAQHLNFFTILILASVPNPLFDLAGILCGQFGIPFWEFFLATVIGKAIIKAHIQTIFIISLCNNQLLYLMEEKLIWLLGNIPGFSASLPAIIRKLQKAKEKFLSAPLTASSNSIITEKKRKFSLSTIWNAVVWFMLINFFLKIVTSTAQNYLKKQQDLEICNLSQASRTNTKSARSAK